MGSHILSMRLSKACCLRLCWILLALLLQVRLADGPLTETNRLSLIVNTACLCFEACERICFCRSMLARLDLIRLSLTQLARLH